MRLMKKEMKENIEILQDRLKEKDKVINDLLERITNLEFDVERLENIINGMEKFFQYAYDNEVKPLNDRKISVWTICLDKLQELKETSEIEKYYNGEIHVDFEEE